MTVTLAQAQLSGVIMRVQVQWQVQVDHGFTQLSSSSLIMMYSLAKKLIMICHDFLVMIQVLTVS